MAYGDDQWERGDRRIQADAETPKNDNPARIVPEMALFDRDDLEGQCDANAVIIIRARAAKLNAAVEAAEAQGLSVHVAKDRQSNKIAAITAAKEF